MCENLTRPLNSERHKTNESVEAELPMSRRRNALQLSSNANGNGFR